MSCKIVVLGGGISGLSGAYYLARNLVKRGLPHEITLLEKGKLGGWIQTEDTGKSLFELGPRSLRTAGFVGGNAIKLAEDLGLADSFINVTQNALSSKNRYIYADNKLNPFPASFLDCFKVYPPMTRSISSVYLKGLFKEASLDAETVHDVISSRFGEDIADLYADPFVRGVFAADSKELSLKAAFPAFWNMLKNKKLKMPRKPKLNDHLVRLHEHTSSSTLHLSQQERWTQWNLEGGLTQFISALEEGCSKKNVEIRTNSEVVEMSLHENGTMDITYQSVDSESGETCTTQLTDIDHVISTIPAHSLSKILEDVAESSHRRETLCQIGSDLAQIECVDVGMVNLEYEGPPSYILPHLGFGHLVPSCVESKVLGIVYDSCVFPQHDRKEGVPVTRLTCMMGGSWFNDLFGDPEHVSHHDLEQTALESVSEQLGIKDDPLTVITNLHRKCIPTYRVGHTDLVEKIEDALLENSVPVYLAGMSYWGVSVNDCIYNSRCIAESLSHSVKSK